ncbi:MAG: hypothetical protein ACXIUL_11325 [Wenzhouxiangella sp.]
MFNGEFERMCQSRIDKFRKIEADLVVGKRSTEFSAKSFSLLRDIEMSYATKSYYACLVLAFCAIEASLNKVFGNSGSMKEKIQKSGYADEADWLRDVRNKLVHKESTDLISYFPEPELEKILEEYCIRAFKIAHTVHFSPIKNNA